MIRNAILIIFSAAALMGQSPSEPFSLGFQAQPGSHEDPYQAGRGALDAGHWDQAIQFFDEVLSHKGPSADGALYWKAYAQNRAGRRQDAMSTIRVLRKEYPSSRWINDAQALEVEIMGAKIDPGAESDQELKMISLNALMQTSPELAFPILEKVLTSNNSAEVKERALFVLTQSPLPQAHKLLTDIARGSSNPDLQEKAIKYMGMMGNDDSRKELLSIYNSTGDMNVKHAILKSMMVSGSRSFLLNVAKSEKDSELRADAIRQLALTGARDELWQLYQSSSSIEDKEEILKSMFLSGNSARLVEIAQSSNTDPRLRVAAIKSLGLMGRNGQGDVLVTIYKSDQNRDVRENVLKALFIQGNAKALIELARAEKDPEMKRDIVRNLSLINSKETTDYMMEILK